MKRRRPLFESMRDVVPRGRRGVARVDHFTVDRNGEIMSIIERNHVPQGRYARLVVRDTLVMSDTPMERRTNVAVVMKAHGRVLIAGFGLGLVLVPILRKPEVTRVEVVEIEPDVIRLVQPHITRFVGPRAARKLVVHIGDVFSWRPPKDARFNTIYFDVWPEVGIDDLDSMASLHRAFARFKDRDDPDAWMSSWRVDFLRLQRRSAYPALAALGGRV